MGRTEGIHGKKKTGACFDPTGGPGICMSTSLGMRVVWSLRVAADLPSSNSHEMSTGNLFAEHKAATFLFSDAC